MPVSTIYVPFPRDVYDDFIRYTTIDPVEMMHEQLWDFVERTSDSAFSKYSIFRSEEDAWEFMDKHFPEVTREWREQDLNAAAADRATRTPLIWKEVEVPHGSEVRMHYGGEYHLAEIKNGKIVDADGAFSPSEWASKIASGTARNAWRDLWFKEPLSRHWVPAQVLRDQAREPKNSPKLDPVMQQFVNDKETDDGNQD